MWFLSPNTVKLLADNGVIKKVYWIQTLIYHYDSHIPKLSLLQVEPMKSNIGEVFIYSLVSKTWSMVS